MAANLTAAEANRLLDLSMTDVELALLTADPGEAGSLASEISGGGYARQAVAFNAAASGATNPTADVSYPQATALWGDVSHVALVAKAPAADAGTARWHGPLTATKTIDVNDTFTIPAADLDVSLD